MITFGGTVVNVRNSFVNNCGVIVQVVIKLALINKLRVIRVDWFDLYSDFQISLGVDGLVNLAERSFIDLSGDLEVLSYFL